MAKELTSNHGSDVRGWLCGIQLVIGHATGLVAFTTESKETDIQLWRHREFRRIQVIRKEAFDLIPRRENRKGGKRSFEETP